MRGLVTLESLGRPKNPHHTNYTPEQKAARAEAKRQGREHPKYIFFDGTKPDGEELLRKQYGLKTDEASISFRKNAAVELGISAVEHVFVDFEPAMPLSGDITEASRRAVYPPEDMRKKILEQAAGQTSISNSNSVQAA